MVKWLCTECRKTKSKESLWPITENTDSVKNQSKLKASTCRQCETRKNRRKYVFLVGWRSGVRLLNQSQIVVNQNKRNRQCFSARKWKRAVIISGFLLAFLCIYWSILSRVGMKSKVKMLLTLSPERPGIPGLPSVPLKPYIFQIHVSQYKVLPVAQMIEFLFLMRPILNMTVQVLTTLECSTTRHAKCIVGASCSKERG